MSNKIKKISIVLGYVLLGLYVLFLALPLIVSPIVNSYKADIEKIITDSIGFKTKIEKISVVTSWNLAVGAKLGEISLSLPESDTPFFTAKNVGGKLALLPILVKKIQIDSVFADDVVADIAIKKDGNILLLDYLPKSEGVTSSEAVDSLPLGLKLSNRLPNVLVKSYKLGVSDVSTKRSYFIKNSDSKKFKGLKITDFVLDKRVKVSLNGNVVFDDSIISSYDVKLDNRIMPNLQLHDLVFPEKLAIDNDIQTQNQEEFLLPFNIIEILNSVKNNEFTSVLFADVKTSGVIQSPKIDGNIILSDLSVAVNGKKLPKSFIDIKFDGYKTFIDSTLYSSLDENEVTKLNGKLYGGKRPFIDVSFNSNAKFNNLFRLIDSIARTFGVKEFNSLSATGGIDASLKVKSDFKKVNSEGYLKIPNSSVFYGLYNLKIDDIKANISLDDNSINISDTGLSIFGQPLSLSGSILSDSTTDLSLLADKLSIKGILAACGQLAILKDNNIKSGSVSLKADVKGKLNSIKPEVVASIDALDVHNIPSQTSVLLNNANAFVNYDGKSASGELNIKNFGIVNPLANISIPTTKVLVDQKDISLKDSYIMFNNSKIDLSGAIYNYLSDKLRIDLKASGNIKSVDIASLLPVDFRKLISYKGELPLKIIVDGSSKVQNIKITLDANPENYIALVDLDLLKNKNTKIHSNIEIIGDSVNLTNTGISNDNSQITKVSGSINKLYTKPELMLNVSIPRLVSFPIWGIPNSNISAIGNVSVVGSALDPQMRGTVNVTDISMSDFLFKMSDLVVDLTGPILNGVASLKEFKVGGIVATDIIGNVSLKDYSKLYLSDLSGKAFDGVLKGNLTYDLLTTKIALQMTGEKLNSTKAVEGAVGIPKALTGVLNFDTKLKMEGVTDKEIIQSMSGDINFNIGEGRFISIGRLENLVSAQNVSSNSVLKTAISALSSVQIIQETDKYKQISGNLVLGKGSANISKIIVVGPLMAYHVSGKYNIIPNTANLLILGRLDSKVVSVLGPLGELSADKLLAYIPKLGSLTSSVLNQVTVNPEKENTSVIPALSSGSESYKDFKVEFVGSATSATSVKSFKWLSTCDTSAIDYKQEFKEAKEVVESTVKGFKDAFNQIKSDVSSSKENSKQSAENLKNLFKGVLKNAQ